MLVLNNVSKISNNFSGKFTYSSPLLSCHKIDSTVECGFQCQYTVDFTPALQILLISQAQNTDGGIGLAWIGLFGCQLRPQCLTTVTRASFVFYSPRTIMASSHICFAFIFVVYFKSVFIAFVPVFGCPLGILYPSQICLIPPYHVCICILYCTSIICALNLFCICIVW